MKKLIASAAVALMVVGSAGVAQAKPYGKGEGPGPGNSGNSSMFGLCTAYANNSAKAKEKSPVFNQYDAETWAELCENVTPGGKGGE